MYSPEALLAMAVWLSYTLTLMKYLSSSLLQRSITWPSMNVMMWAFLPAIIIIGRHLHLKMDWNYHQDQHLLVTSLYSMSKVSLTVIVYYKCIYFHIASPSFEVPTSGKLIKLCLFYCMIFHRWSSFPNTSCCDCSNCFMHLLSIFHWYNNNHSRYCVF